MPEKMGEGPGRGQVVDGHDLEVRTNRGDTEEPPADSAQAVDPDADGQTLPPERIVEWSGAEYR
jgi:hypothetical protein